MASSQTQDRPEEQDDSTTGTLPNLERKLVVAALITDGAGRVLLSQRLPDRHLGGMWELPGGKVEPGEPPAIALAREVEEELGCACQVGVVYEVIHHRYPRFELVMIVYRTELTAAPMARDVAQLAWVPPEDLGQYDVLPADVPLLRRITEQGRVDPAAPAPRASFAGLTRARSGAFATHYLHERLREELDRSARYGRPLSVVLIDVDDLSAINDRHGRAVGDEILAQLVALITQNARGIDRVGHTSGGGFALLLPETPSGAALGIAERLRADIAARRFSTRGPTPGVRLEVRCTISCGVASARTSRANEPDAVLTRADAALWRAKVAGRNRTLVEGAGKDGDQ